MAVPAKDTIYIDIDDEITGIIDKLRASDAKVLALVLPKRAAVLQSVVNMKLLKRAADDAKKHVVLITSEAGLLPLAGMVGLYIAKSLTSKPEIPLAPHADDEEETVEDLGEANDKPQFDPEKAANVPVGALAGLPPSDDVETVELDDHEADTADKEAEKEADGSDENQNKNAKKPKKDKTLKVPNFRRFRLILILGIVLLLLLIVGAVAALSVLPKATIGITTDATNVNSDLNLNLSTSADTLNTNSDTVPATLAQQSKTYTQQVATTGQQNEGNEASGSIMMTAEECAPNLGQPPDVPAGIGVTANNLTYITQQDTSFNFTKFQGGSCADYSATDPTPITAQNPGSSYNTSAGSVFTVAGRSDVSASADGAITGGTDNIVQIVSQTDINNAKSKISTNDTSVKQALENQLNGQGLYPINVTFTAGTPTVTSSANVGTPATTVTVTEAINYTMFGVHKSDLQTLIDNSVNSQIDTSKQSILDDGLSNAVFSVQNNSSSGAQVSMQVVSEAGPQLDTATIKQQVAGKKSGDVKNLLETDPDVTNVTVKLSPFWVSAVPTKTSKITVNIAKPTTTSNTNASNQ